MEQVVVSCNRSQTLNHLDLVRFIYLMQEQELIQFYLHKMTPEGTAISNWTPALNVVLIARPWSNKYVGCWPNIGFQNLKGNEVISGMASLGAAVCKMSSKTATKGCFYVGTKILGPAHPHLSLPLEYTGQDGFLLLGLCPRVGKSSTITDNEGIIANVIWSYIRVYDCLRTAGVQFLQPCNHFIHSRCRGDAVLQWSI